MLYSKIKNISVIKGIISRLNNKKKSFIKNINNTISLFCGNQLNIIYVLEYPKCGGTWVSNLIRCYLGVKKEYGNSRIVKKNSVIQRHELFNKNHKNVIVVLRDPRDVITSYYYHELYHKQSTIIDYIDYKPYDETGNFERYIQEKLSNPDRTFPFFSYSDFVESFKNKNSILFIKYEDLHKDTYGIFKKIILHLNLPLDTEKAIDCIRINKFSNIAGRNPGTEVKTQHTRKGIVGDWKDKFSRKAALTFYELNGDFLKKLGYESDDTWISNFDKGLK